MQLAEIHGTTHHLKLPVCMDKWSGVWGGGWGRGWGRGEVMKCDVKK